MPDPILCIGYLAVLTRLSIESRDTFDKAGAAGTLLPSTLANDAALVAFELGLRGRPVSGVFSHPGSLPDGEKAIALLDDTLADLRLGEDRGAPYELQLLFGDGTVLWTNDPGPGLRSLESVPEIGATPGTAYLDVFEWLEPVLSGKAIGPFENLFVNLGVRELDNAIETTRSWRKRVAGTLFVQVSALQNGQADTARDLAEAIAREGADLVVATAGRRGLVMYDGRETRTQPAPRVDGFKDAAGAGAAVSTALLDLWAGGGVTELGALARAASDAGREQCAIDGALGARARAAWVSGTRS